MAAPDPALERGPLIFSILVTSAIGALGIAWGLWVGSQMILLDGAYAVIGVLVSWMLLAASRLAASEPDGRYPFGREGITPIVIGVQGFVLLATLAYAAVEAVNVALEGGSDIEAGWATVYGIISAAASVGFWAWLRTQAPDSDLIKAESAAWRIGSLRSVGMVVGFGLMMVVERWGSSTIAGYIDPAMVLITCVVFAPTPLAMVRNTILELLEGEPADAIREPVAAAVATIFTGHHLADPVLRLSKLGPKLYVEVEALGSPAMTIAEKYEVVAELREELDALPYDVWLNVEVKPE